MNGFKIMCGVLFGFMLFSSFAAAIERSDYVKLIENPPCLIDCYTVYEVCNPRETDILLTKDKFKFFFRTKTDMTLRETVSALKLYKIERLKNVTNYWDEAVYDDVEHEYVCEYEFNYTLSPVKYAWCYTENGTVVFEHEFERGDILKKTVYWNEWEITGYKQVPYVVEEYSVFNPIDKTFAAGSCHKIKISGKKKPFEAVDNVLSYNGVRYTEYAWWNVSYPYRYPIISNSTIQYALSVNDTGGIVGDIIWSYIGNSSYVYSTLSGPIGDIAIANETDEKWWENETSRTGNSVTSLWGENGANATAVWHLGEASGTIYDSTSNNHDGTAHNNPTYGVDGVFGKGITFDGSTQYISFPTFHIANAITVEAWIYPTDIAELNEAIVAKDDVDASKRCWFLQTSSGAIRFYVWNAGGTGVDARGGSMSNSNWYYVVGTYNKDGGSGNLKVYLNGTLVDSDTQTGAIRNYDNTINIANTWQASYPQGRFTGPIDEVRITPRELTADEILVNYWNGVNNHTRLGGREENSSLSLSITVDSPIDNNEYITQSIWFNVSLNKEGDWCGYSLDEFENVTMTQESTTIFTFQNSSVNFGSHSVVFWCNDTDGKFSTTNTTSFNVLPGLFIDVKDETNKTTILFDMMVTNATGTQLNFTNVTTANIYSNNITGTLTLTVVDNLSLYNQRSYTDIMIMNEQRSRTLYLLKKSESHPIYIYIKDGLGVEVSGANVTVARKDGYTYYDVAEATTDESGMLIFNLNDTATYRFTVEHSDYLTKYQYITPTEEEYTITLSGLGSGEIELESELGDVVIYFRPIQTALKENDAQLFSLNISTGASNPFDYWGFNLTYPNGINAFTNTSSTATGGYMETTINTTNLSGTWVARVFLKRTGYDERWYDTDYTIYEIEDIGNFSLSSIIDGVNDESFGPFGSLTIGVLSLIITILIMAAIGFEFPGVTLVGLVVLGAFTYLSWFPTNIYVICVLGTLAIAYIRRGL